MLQLLVDRTTLVQRCSDAGAGKKGNMESLRKSLVCNFLQHASAEEILDESSDRIVPLAKGSSEELPAATSSSSCQPTSQSKDSKDVSASPKIKKSTTATSLATSNGEADTLTGPKEAGSMLQSVLVDTGTSVLNDIGYVHMT